MIPASRVYKVHGIVLKRRNIGEADRIVTLFTKEAGKIRVIAKGVRRITSRRASHLEVFRHVTVSLHKGKNLDIVTEVESVALLDATSSIQKISFAYYICELADQLLADHQEHADVVSLVTTAFDRLNRGATISEWQQGIVAFALELLWTLGFLPRTKMLSEQSIQPYIESIIEKRLRTPAILTKLSQRE